VPVEKGLRVFVFYEEYVDDDAVAVHRKHLGELVNLATFLDGAPQLEFLEKLAADQGDIQMDIGANGVYAVPSR